jgi:D-threo-aldose 1-dehydrogenase
MTSAHIPGLTALTLGTSPLGRDSLPGSAEEDTAVETAIAMLRSGHFVDTANMYAGGRSEEVIGIALGELSADERDAAAARLITKVDRDLETGILDGDRVRRSYDESLTRLGLDRVRYLHLHDPYLTPFAEASAAGGSIEAMVALRESGATDVIGIAAGKVPVVAQYVATGAFDLLLLHNRLTLVDQSATGLMTEAKNRGMTVFNAAPFGGDLLAKGSAAGTSYAYRPVTDDLRAWTARAEEVCARHGVALNAVALQYSLRSPLVDSTVVGISSPARLDEARAFAATEIPDGVWGEIEALGAAPSTVRDDLEPVL